jgi:prepilin-type processing-associated H-X9-DG protein
MKSGMAFTKKDIVVSFGCVVFLLVNLGLVGNIGRERAKIIVCQTNLKKLGQVQILYLNDNDDMYPNPLSSIVEPEQPYFGYPRYCRWHDSGYPPNGLLLPYITAEKILLCPTFNDLAKQFGGTHAGHDASIPVEPQYSYSMNAWLGSRTVAIGGGVLKSSEITRNKSEVFLFAEENFWMRPGCMLALNDTALCPDGRDWFGTFHNASQLGLNKGTVNAVFVDGHVQEVRSALSEESTDTSEMEFGMFEKYGWPFKKEPFQ